MERIETHAGTRQHRKVFQDTHDTHTPGNFVIEGSNRTSERLGRRRVGGGGRERVREREREEEEEKERRTCVANRDNTKNRTIAIYSYCSECFVHGEQWGAAMPTTVSSCCASVRKGSNTTRGMRRCDPLSKKRRGDCTWHLKGHHTSKGIKGGGAEHKPPSFLNR
jgi:hypothetical protein